MAPQLLALSGPLAGQTLTLQPGENTLGREAGNTIVIDDQAVSRRHAKIMVINGVATVEDSGSTSGTWVNDLRVTAPTLLKVGDSLRLGATAFSFIPVSVAGPDLGQRKPREKSRYQEAGGPVPFTAPAAPSSGAGCMPDINQMMADFNGCLGPLMRYIIIALIVLLVICLLGAIVMGIGAIGAIGAAGAGAGGGASAAGGGAGGDDGGGAAGQQPPPQQQQQQQQQPPPPAQETASIEIVKVRVAYLAREGYTQPQAIVLVTWRNRSQQPVAELDADIKGFDRANRPVGLMKKVTVYKGDPVAPGETHEDKETEGTIFPVDTPPNQPPPLLDHAELDKLMVR